MYAIKKHTGASNRTLEGTPAFHTKGGSDSKIVIRVNEIFGKKDGVVNITKYQIRSKDERHVARLRIPREYLI